MTIFGCQDRSISPHLKIWLTQGGITVVGIKGESTSKEVTDNWTSPLEGESIGQKFQKAGGLLQNQTGLTSQGTMGTIQTWNGSQPHNFNIGLVFIAYADAFQEVTQAIRAIELMRSPELNQLVGGRIPETVWLNIGRTRVFPDCVITSMSEPMNNPVDSRGNYIKCEIDLQLQTKTTLNKSDVAGTYRAA